MKAIVFLLAGLWLPCQVALLDAAPIPKDKKPVDSIEGEYEIVKSSVGGQDPPPGRELSAFKITGKELIAVTAKGKEDPISYEADFKKGLIKIFKKKDDPEIAVGRFKIENDVLTIIITIDPENKNNKTPPENFDVRTPTTLFLVLKKKPTKSSDNKPQDKPTTEKSKEKPTTR